MKVFPACVLHQYGATFFVGATEEHRTKAIADWCRQYWQQEGITGDPPDSDEAVIDRYFHDTQSDTIWLPIEPEEIIGAEG